MASIETALSKCLAYAADDSHGYELGWHSASAMGGGTDCSGLVRYYAALLAGVGVNSFPDFSTRTERRVLTGRGWTAIAFSLAKARRGDVLLTESNGHTVIYLGDGRILGAEGDWDGRRGDSGGREVCERDYYAYGYNWILRPPTGAAGEEDEVTDADIEKIARKVWEYDYKNTAPGGNMYNAITNLVNKMVPYMGWQYKNKDVNGDKDAYQLLTEIHKAILPWMLWQYKNKDVNGDKDAYQLLTEIHDWTGELLERAGGKAE